MTPPRDIAAALRGIGVSDVTDDSATLCAYATDASIYRVVPQVVARPRHSEEIAAILAVARDAGVPVTMRGAGTSIAGNAIGAGIVVDTSRYLNRIIDVDAPAGTATVQPGVVAAALTQQVAPHGLRLGPDPSTHARCTIGGMLGNNACGTRALGYGRSSDVVQGLEVITAAGDVLRLGNDDAGLPDRLRNPLRQLVNESLGTLRTEFGRFGRHVSGYSLEHLLPENGRDLSKAFVGSEGTLGVVSEATVSLSRTPAAVGLLVLGSAHVTQAARAVPQVLPHRPIACEGMDERLVDALRRSRGASAVPQLPRGRAWLFIEVGGETDSAVRGTMAAIRNATGDPPALIAAAPAQQASLWRLREIGAGLAARTTAGEPAYAGWEDAAVPPDRLGDYLAEFERLVTDFGYETVPYGHFGEGCVHARITFGFGEPGARERYGEFTQHAAELVARYDGSVSGEHGDGRARSSVIGAMYSPAATALFERVKTIFDPEGVLNPGIIADPVDLTADIRDPSPGGSDADLADAAHRCTGVGACRVQTLRDDQIMCPSFIASASELDSTRGRARVLQDATTGALGTRGLAAPEVEQALDLCLACKACARDCPTGVDMAELKSHALHRRYDHAPRPIAHHTLGRIADVLRIAERVPGGGRALAAANAVLASPFGGATKRAAGIHPQRPLPRFSPRTATEVLRGHPDVIASVGEPQALVGDGRDVVLFIDTFTQFFGADIALAAARVLDRARWRVHATAGAGCCGVPLVSTGQRDLAAQRAGSLVAELDPYVAAGGRLVGLEPSCASAVVDDAPRLLPGSVAAQRVGVALDTFAAVMAGSDVELIGRLAEPVVAQPHCHQHATFGYASDMRILGAIAPDVTRVPGCCGMAGNFGAEREHYNFSLRVAGSHLVPRLTEHPAAMIVADGFSCRTQLGALPAAAGRRGLHLAQVLERRLPSENLR